MHEYDDPGEVRNKANRIRESSSSDSDSGSYISLDPDSSQSDSERYKHVYSSMNNEVSTFCKKKIKKESKATSVKRVKLKEYLNSFYNQLIVIIYIKLNVPTKMCSVLVILHGSIQVKLHQNDNVYFSEISAICSR